MIHALRSDVDRRVADVGVAQAGGELGVAALLYTYRCTIACRHCCFNCAGQRPDIHMTTPQAVAHLESLHQLGRVIHVAGGEAMIYWDDLQDVLAASAERGCQPHFIETNCSFASTDAVVAQRLDVLARWGVVGLLFSADPFHQAFVPPDRVLRVRRLATERFGAGNVWGPGIPDHQVADFPAIAADENRLADYVRAHPPVLVGRAQRELRGHFPQHPLAALPGGARWRDPCPGPDCAVVFDKARIWELHIDPYDNIQTNCGVVLGNARRTPIIEVLRRGPAEANAIVRLLAREGPVGLARFAHRVHGYVVPETACTKCDLCCTVRRFLRPFYPDILGPDEVYAA